MLRDVVYINHVNESIQFGKNGIFLEENDLLDFSWAIQSKNDKISGFKRGIVSKKVPIFIKSASDQEAIKQRNRLFEVFEKDVLANKPGKLIVGDYYLKCFITESKKSNYSRLGFFIRNTMTISTDLPFWIKESKTTFNYGNNASSGTNLDYGRDFPYDYTSNMLGISLNNTGFVEVNFQMKIYGPCENPLITIGGHSYEVLVYVAAHEYLTIDSISKTIVLTHTDGTQENCFKFRNKDSYIFRKIPAGVSKVSSNAAFKFDVILLEERSEPKWI